MSKEQTKPIPTSFDDMTSREISLVLKFRKASKERQKELLNSMEKFTESEAEE